MIINDLINLKCKACSGKTPKLNNQEIDFNIKKLNDWQINDERKMIFKRIVFKSFNKSLDFINLVGVIAEKEGHHPDISFGWGYCLILLHTHAIKGLSINDFILASKIDQIKIKN